MRAMGVVCAMLRLIWQACIVALAISEYKCYWCLRRWTSFNINNICIKYFIVLPPFFGISQQADLALQEAIRIAQESNDHVCLQHCLVSYCFPYFCHYFT